MENYLLLASTVQGGCCVFPSVFLRVFLAASARQLHARAGAVRGVTPLSPRVSRRGPSLSHGRWPLAWPALGASQAVFWLLKTPLARSPEGWGRTSSGDCPQPFVGAAATGIPVCLKLALNRHRRINKNLGRYIVSVPMWPLSHRNIAGTY